MPWKRSDISHLIGARFGHLVIIEDYPTPAQSERRVWCRCDCGSRKTFNLSNVRRGLSRSCGCIFRTQALEAHYANLTLDNRSEYLAWGSMHTRCRNPKCAMYPNYGGRGIRVCERWRHFKYFLEDMGVKPTLKHSLDRIDVNGNYEPENCRWATSKEQALNRTTSHIIEINGIRKTLTEWCHDYGVGYTTVLHRIKCGWDEERAVASPVATPCRMGPLFITWQGLTLTAAEWSRKTGIQATTIRARHRKGWPPERVLTP